MKIVHIITKAERGGAQVHVLGLIRHQIAAGQSVHLLSGDDGFLTEQARLEGASVLVCSEIIHPIRPWHDFLAVQRLVKRLAQLMPDLVHAHSSKAGLLARLACRQAQLPCLFTAHGWAFSEGAPALRRHVARLAETACAALGHPIVNVSAYDKNLALNYRVGQALQHRVIHNGLPDLEATPPHASPVASSTIVMVARFAAPKRQDLLIRALLSLPPTVTLRLLGDGPNKAMCEVQAKQLGVAARVQFVGDCDEVARHLAEAQVFVLLSDHEGLPLTVIEAMRAGLPVVASAVGGIPELVDDGVSGLLVSEAKPEAVAKALSTLLDTPERARQMGQCGRMRYLSHFTEQQMLAKLDALYEEILAKNR